MIIQSHDNRLQRIIISELHRSYDALQYPVMFYYGEDGYSIDISQKDATIKCFILNYMFDKNLQLRLLHLKN